MTDQKYRVDGGRLRADPTSATLLPGSVLATERLAAFYGRRLPVVARGRLADLGCGTAPLRPFYSRFTDGSLTLDWPRSVHRVAIDAFADVGGGVPLRTASVDTVLASDVLEHLVDPAGFLSECGRVLRPGGSLVGNVPFLYGIHEEPHDYFRYTEHGLRHLLTSAGFQRVEIEVLGGGVDVIVDIAAKLIAQVPVVGPAVARALQATWLSMTAPPAVRRRLTEVERRLPLAYGFTAGR